MSALLDGLNDKQREGVLATEGPVLLLAGAGSGKTRVLTHRTAYLISEKGVAPWNILAITFTNKAADEMRERIETICGNDGGMVWVGTFHKTCGRILRMHAELLGYTSQFTIYDTTDQKTLVKMIIKDWDLDPKMYNERSIRSAISSAKDKMEDPDYMYKVAINYHEQKVAEIYEEYQKRLKANDAMDFDDMLVNTVELFRKHPEVLEQWQRRFRYIMVDEYQDTNAVQFALISLLASRDKNICVVGDDDQSIYKFRGADVTNIFNFEKTFPGTKIIKLEQNYRSTSSILDTANEVIKNNEERMDKRLWTEKKGGDVVDFRIYENAQKEAEGLVLDIKENKAKYDYGECAVLYRTNAQSRLLEEFCVKYGVPYRIVGGLNFYQRKEIKDMIAYLKTIVNGVDDLAVQRIINVPKRGLGKTTIDKIASMAVSRGINFFEAIRLAETSTLFNSGTKKKLADFVSFIEDMRGQIGVLTVRELVETIFEKSGYKAELEAEKLGSMEDRVSAESRIENIGELINKAAEFDEEDKAMALTHFLEDVSLTADVDAIDDEENRVLLMTLHGAKGLEFPRVYMTGMEEGLFPSSMSLCEDERGVEEERRLCYVGITRAKEKLSLCMAKERMINGTTTYGVTSRFISEIPRDLIERNTTARLVMRSGDSFSGSLATSGGGFGARMYDAPARPEKWTNPYLSKKPSTDVMAGVRKGSEIEKGDESSLGYKVGDRVRHVRFGEGKVLKIEEEDVDFNVTVSFDRVGEKEVYASFAKLVKIDD